MKKVSTTAMESQLINLMVENMKYLYNNKSSDEYKSMGDITKTFEYNSIERMVADLKTLKKYDKSDAADLQQLFVTLHRPIFKNMVVEYMTEPNDRNTVFTAVYTAGFRVLVGELSRIYSSTESTKDGIIYKPDKIAKRQNVMPFIRTYNDSLEKRINDYVRSKVTTEIAIQESMGNTILTRGKIVGRTISRVFPESKEINPISFINSVLMASYQKKVDDYEYIANMYNASKEAYADYMKLPASQRDSKIENAYLKNIDKYNINMQNAKAKIEHYEQRAIKEAENQVMNDKSVTPTTSSVKPNTDADTSFNDFDF